MNGRRKLDDEQIEQLIAWRERGWSYDRIARQLGVSNGAIHYRCLKHAVLSPRQRSLPVPTGPRTFVAGDGRTQRRFTQAEDARLIELEMAGMNYLAIARAVGRPTTSVRIRLMTLAQHQALADGEAD